MSPPEPFEPLPIDTVVFRLAKEDSKFLPPGALSPNADIWAPSSGDEAEGKERGRPPGVSVWDVRRTSPAQAITIRFGEKPPPTRAFAAKVQAILAAGEQHGRTLHAFADPLPVERGPGADGHALIEGIARPIGVSRVEHKQLLDALVQILQELR